MSADLTLEPSTEAPRVARQFVARHAAGLPEGLVDDAQVLVSELVTNAVRYGRPAITVGVAATADEVIVEVHDTGEVVPALPAGLPELTRTSGRGLIIVAALASEWGISATPDRAGKSVWFQLRTASA